MSFISPKTPLEALECAISRAWLLDRYKRGLPHTKPGDVINEMPAEYRRLLRELRSEDMLSIPDYIAAPK